MDFKQLSYYRAVYETLNFTASAKQLHISQQGLSKAIQNLERELNGPLFLREKNRLKPTDFGKVFYKEAEHLLEEYRKSMQVLETAREQRQRLKIGFSASTFGALNGIENELLRFEKLYPEFSVELSNETDYVCEEKIEKGELDAAFSMGDFASADLQTHQLMEETIYALFPKDAPQAGKAELTIQELDGEPLIIADKRNKGYETLWMDFHKQGLEPRIAFCSDDIQTHFRLTKKGLGISLLPEHMLTLLPESYGLRPVPVSDLRKRRIYLIYKKRREMEPAVKRLVQFLVTETKAYEKHTPKGEGGTAHGSV